MGYLYLLADAGNVQAERGRQWRDLVGGAMLQADLLEGRGTITSIKGTTPTGWVRFWGGENETWDWM